VHIGQKTAKWYKSGKIGLFTNSIMSGLIENNKAPMNKYGDIEQVAQRIYVSFIHVYKGRGK